ncbi:hypothetical protein SCHPADRAFT_482385 [Schizopora paradoxa]|uniref:F-box domain-containing protein n=1 Tax=Schizopora paradoxa TaxID=27342 RepID=A0A0H2RHU8_9AGAM|nr:hypothetical protein SCHPADRAFT_482385 [Schizopora paradoxa]
MLSLFRHWKSRSKKTSPKSTQKKHAEEPSSIRCFVASIPEDALAMIFDFVFTALCAEFDSETSPDHPPALSIMKLSHVNQRFRLVSLSYPHLWTHISSTLKQPEMGLVKACLERSRDLPVTVHLTIYLCGAYYPFCDDVTAAARKCAHRWRSVHIHFAYIHCTPLNASELSVDPTRGTEEMRDISAPALEYLRLISEGSSLDEELLFLETWNVPRLHGLTTVHSFPSKLSSFMAITSLDMKLGLFRTGQSNDFLDLIRSSKIPNLTDLSITIDHDERFWRRDIGIGIEPPYPITPIPSIQRLRITTSIGAHRNLYGEGRERDLFHALSFPNARDLSVTFEGEHQHVRDPMPHFYLSHIAERIFITDDVRPADWDPKYRQFPRVDRLVINISSSGLEPDKFAGEVASFLLPLHIFPSLKDLCVRANIPVDPYTHMLHYGRYEQPALRHIEFDISRVASPFATASPFPLRPEHWEWFCAVADKLMARGVWHEFEKLTLIERVFETNPDGTVVTKSNVKSEFLRDMLFKDADSGGF